MHLRTGAGERLFQKKRAIHALRNRETRERIIPTGITHLVFFMFILEKYTDIV
jgi:hypothetical protein